jgi:protein SCO1/2
MRRNTWLCIAAIAALFFAAIGPRASASTPGAADNSYWGPNYFPNIELTTQDGKKVRFYDDLLKGKLVVVDLIYTSCDFSCPLETARLAQVQKLLGDRVGKDIFFYSISIDPKRDTPAKLKAYAKKFHVGPGWLFLTGKKADIDEVSKKLGLYTSSDINKDGHATSLMIGDVPNGQWMRNSAVDNPRFLATQITEFLHMNQDMTTGASYAQAAPISITHKGQYLFSTRCSACHTIGGGDRVGPDLIGVTNVRKHDWLTRFIQSPDRVLAAKDPVATALFRKYNRIVMPNLQLGPDDVQYLINYLALQTASVAPAAGASEGAKHTATTTSKASAGGR